MAELWVQFAATGSWQAWADELKEAGDFSRKAEQLADAVQAVTAGHEPGIIDIGPDSRRGDLFTVNDDGETMTAAQRLIIDGEITDVAVRVTVNAAATIATGDFTARLDTVG